MRCASEDELFRRYCERRDVAALAALFDQTSPALLRIAGHLSPCRADAEDLLQQTFLAAIEGAGSWDSRRPVFAWLCGILTRQAGLRRRAAARAIDPQRLPVRDEPGPGEVAERRELEAAIAAAVAELGEVYRPVLHLHLDHGLDAQQIGRALGRPAGSVRTQLVRGLQRLRRALPVGLGVAAVAVTAGSGVAAVRAAVLARAGELTAVAGMAGAPAAGLAIGGWLMLKQASVGIALLLLLLAAGWWLLPHTAAAPPEQRAAPADVVAAAPSQSPLPSAQRDAAVSDRERTPAAAPGGTVRVRVTGVLAGAPQDSKGFGVADAAVELWQGGDAPPFPGPAKTQCTDGDGSAEFASLPPGSFRLRAVLGFGSEGIASAVAAVDVGEATMTEVSLALPMTAALRGRVVDEGGRPVAGAEVWLGDEVLGRAGRPEQLLRRAAASGDDGAFAVQYSTRAREFRLAARKHGYAASWSQFTHMLGEGEVTLVLPSGAAGVRGAVVDDAGLPIAGASIALQLEGETQWRDAHGDLYGAHLPALCRSDARGMFTADDLAPGRYQVRADAAGHLSATAHFEVAAYATAELRLPLAPALSIRGRIVGPQGKPVAGATVWRRAEDATAPADGLPIIDTSDDLGRFAFVALPVRPFVLEAVLCGTRVQRRIERPCAPGIELELVLEERPGVRGRIVDEKGRPVAGYRAVAYTTEGEFLAGAACREDGSFTLRDLGPGPFRIAAGPGRGPTLVAEVSAVAGGEDEVVLVVPRSALPTTYVRGRVVGSDGLPIQGAELRLRFHLLAQSAAHETSSVAGMPASRSDYAWCTIARA